ncbi:MULTISPECIES: hypothetical protein [Micromonospora]|uniref:Four helix bundle sensory module for signal transduction n=1 Tax=Micromonospora solifontis TaxID=2487138 RepID=A0ABX9WFC1_9ACTN|nr:MULTISPECIES: hypothetical protein [Micromonospora]NES16409.1 hypothetical protein [Micromonospora sp. PPF5-17B]NES37238.1 hypothetical protein [Micromonospora solifontis]NES57125.1 hypothetical protein [Micromonospora sp. PPF5-6]RNL98588.1 hypothetical protein EFE23_13890 [Micromonospora solifontis]
MKRRTLDLLFSIGGIGLAVLLLVVGIVLTTNANFANNYVHDQLAAQHISFKPANALTDEEKKSECLREYAGQQLTTGKQAECYANEFIGLHLKAISGGKTYADLGGPESALKQQVAQAEQAKAANLPDLQKQLAQVSAQRDTVFKGESLRGMLLTSYGFSEFGRKAEQGALAMYLGAALLLLLSLAGLWHAFRTPASETFAAPEKAKEPVNS